MLGFRTFIVSGSIHSRNLGRRISWLKLTYAVILRRYWLKCGLVFFLSLLYRNDWIRVGLCYPSNTSFQVTFGFLQRHNGSLSKMEEYEPVHSLEELQKKQSERKFYFDSSTG